MAMPPAQLAKALVLANPEFVMAGSADARATLLDLATTTQSYSELIQYLQTYPEEAAAISAALQPATTPSTVAVPLPAGMLDALWAVWTEVETAAFADSSLQGLCWWIVDGLSPGLETGGPADGNWELKPVAPVGMVAFPSVAYKSQAFTVTLQNDAPRHVCAYVRFLRNGTPVEPDGWVSRLPSGVPATFESATVKYAGSFAPQVTVSGFQTGSAPQNVSFAMPANADSLELAFGGLGNRRFDGLTCAGGLGLTYWLDFTATWLASRFPKATGTERWFTKLLANTAICDAALAAGALFLQAADSVAALDLLAPQATAVFLGSGLDTLRASIDTQFGDGSAAAFASTVGWSAQIVAAGLRKQPQTQAWVSAVDAAATMPLAASSSLELRLTVLPDPAFGTFPFELASCQAELAYGGFSQNQTSAVTLAQAAAGALTVTFGSVRNVGAIKVSVKLTDAAGKVLGEGLAAVEPTALGRDRVVPVRVATVEPRVTIEAGTKFAKLRSLAYRDGAYVWDAAQKASGDSTGLELFGITVSERAQSVGYVWNTSKRPMQNCSGTGPVSSPYLMQAVGTMVPANELKTMACGFVQRPALAYEEDSGMFLDPRTTPPALRDVSLAAGPFDLASGLARGRFSSPSLDSVALGQGYAAGVSTVDDRLEILRLTDVAVADAASPLPLLVGGTGDRVGLMDGPVAVAITATGAVLVLERGNARVQAFALSGNSLAIFDGQAVVGVSGTNLRDLALSPDGDIYILSGDRVDILNARGKPICSITGVQAARIAVDSRGLIYTLEASGIVGASGFLEPGIGVWGVV
jgi:hypothetical protein